MVLVFTNIFIYFGIALFALLFLFSINDISFAINFLSLENIDIRLVVMLLLAEPHFAMTLPLLYGYRNNFYTHPIYYIYVPIVILCSSTLLFFYQFGIFFLIFLFANIYHVNRQSVGFLKLQSRASEELAKLYELSLHLMTILCLYFSLFLNKNGILLAFLILSVFFFSIFIISRIINGYMPNLRSCFIFLQGYLIFIPIVVFQDMLTAFAVGISIHYLQYLSISWSVLTKGFGFKLLPIFLVIGIYSALSTGALSGIITSERISLIVLIPTLLQLLHFYYDGLIWKRSDPKVESTLKKALSK